jgi:hypothetical protein
MNLIINLKRNRALAVTTVVLAIIVLSLSCGSQEQLQDQERLPDYVQKMPNGAVEVDIGEASNGSAFFDESGRIFYDWDDYKTKFTLWAASAKGGLSLTRLQIPPLKIFPLITPNDGVADFFPAISIDTNTQDLNITLFIDTDWQELVEGQIFIHTWQHSDPEDRLRPIETVDFSKAIDGVYIHEFLFTKVNNLPGYDQSLYIAVTNMLGEPLECLRKAQNINLSGNEVYVGIAPQLVQP